MRAAHRIDLSRYGSRAGASTMTRVGVGVLAAVAVTLSFTPPLSSQTDVVVQGRVEDAVTLEPVSGVLVTAEDSSVMALTSATGTFSLRLRSRSPLILYAERLGY